ncbi:MAG: glucosamine-6-phosphate deaminase [Verrucomicrobia bacterium]|nr:glucosamine-6-phosphate deaminase [Verrucomicrobiota bacterium]
MEVIIRPDEQTAARLVAGIIAKELHARPQLVLGLATGGTMEKVYDDLARRHREEKLDFSLCRTFNLDEYIGLAPDDPRSYRAYMNRQLFGRVNIDPRNTHLPNGMARDLHAECRHYEHLIHDCGGIDLQLLGIGRSGHIGFNEPLSALRSRTREKALAPTTIEQNAIYFDNDPAKVPKRAITMGVGTILDAHRCIVLVTGKAKADIVAKAVEGPITAMVTASVLQLHARCTVVVDETAAGKLQGTDYYRWIFENEPEWAEFRR